MLTDVQAPFLGTPLVPLKKGSMGNHRLPDRVRTKDLFAEGPRIPYILPYLFLVGTLCHRYNTFCHILPHIAMKVNYGKLRHFCDDPVCPAPIWKLLTSAAVALRVAAVYEACMRGAMREARATAA